MIIAKDLDEAITKAQLNPEKRIHFPGGAICFAEKLPEGFVEQLRQQLPEDNSSTS